MFFLLISYFYQLWRFVKTYKAVLCSSSYANILNDVIDCEKDILNFLWLSIRNGKIAARWFSANHRECRVKFQSQIFVSHQQKTVH